MSPDDTFADVPRRGQLNEEVASGSGSAAVTSGTDPAAAGANNRRSAQSSPVRSSSTGSKMMAVRVQMLDDSITVFQVQVRTDREEEIRRLMTHLSLWHWHDSMYKDFEPLMSA